MPYYTLKTEPIHITVPISFRPTGQESYPEHARVTPQPPCSSPRGWRTTTQDISPAWPALEPASHYPFVLITFISLWPMVVSSVLIEGVRKGLGRRFGGTRRVLERLSTIPLLSCIGSVLLFRLLVCPLMLILRTAYYMGGQVWSSLSLLMRFFGIACQGSSWVLFNYTTLICKLIKV